MKELLRYLSLGTLLAGSLSMMAVETNPQPVKDLLNRIGGAGTSDRIVTIVDETVARDGQETFVLTTSGSKPCVKGSTLSALTTGLGWYLNHTAGVNLSWNSLTTDLSAVDFPLPKEETHSTAACYRYYLNYCTFSYSMSTWTWERWEQEIDYMALHGINMPLQIIGLEEVWRKFLMDDYGYTAKEANDFIGGPSFMAWFGMNNLQGWGGPNPNWWYERQAQLGRKMSARMRELGIEPVLPGFAGMVPDNFQKKTGIAATSQGGWCGFTRPYILDATTSKFPEVAAKYYARLKEVMGESKYYSIDPFHEGGATPSNVDKAYKNLYNAMDKATPGSHFVIQSWQWSGAQYKSLDNIPKGKLLVLDLYSDGRPGWGNYKGHETVYCTIFNFGGRTGLFGRFNGIIDGYFDARGTSSVVGIGAAPEAIEQAPVMYDLLFELPWYSEKPDASRWMAEYAQRRYRSESSDAQEAWELLRTSALDCPG
ncbi:MAG: alpha-N-acetylglucosaminidase, partial [Muribaculaceae bacterium]|nr:alpha-N-acetylglucosaminidase [Muribaculaceae bacterium]